MTEKISLKEAMIDCVELAKKYGNVCYVYDLGYMLGVGHRYYQDWLFRAYPGGRKQLSKSGKQFAEEEGIEL